MRRTFFVFILLFICFTIYSQEKRLALVIGNGNYQYGGILANPENDAKAIDNILRTVGFDVIKYENLEQNSMRQAIDNFGDRLKNYDIGLFFYAGHGIQAKGRNYLIPVDANLKSENDVEYTCVEAGRVLGKMEDARSKTNIVILDACRDNPFERSWTRSSTGRGLAFMNAPTGSLIAYATSPGNTASDGTGENGLYTSALLTYMVEPNITVLQMFQKVRTLVRESSNNQQTPWESTSLEGDFYFVLSEVVQDKQEIIEKTSDILDEYTIDSRDWNYFREIIIDNSSNSNILDDYQIKISIDAQSLISQGKLKNNLSDIMITNSNKETTLNFWIETGDNKSNQNIWVKIPKIEAFSVIKIYLFYGNSNALPRSRGDETFILFDDFNENSLNSSKWESGCFGMKEIKNMNISNSVISFSGNGCGGICTDGVSLCMKRTFYSNENIAVDTRFKFTKDSWGSGAGLWRENQFVGINGSQGCQHLIKPNIAILSENFNNKNWGLQYIFDDSSSNTTLTTLEDNIWYKSTLIRENEKTFIGLILDDHGILLGENSEQLNKFQGMDLNWVTTAIYSCGSRKYYYDWIFVRKYSQQEPNVITGDENINK